MFWLSVNDSIFYMVANFYIHTICLFANLETMNKNCCTLGLDWLHWNLTKISIEFDSYILLFFTSIAKRV
jgi:hypothetical protein